MTIVLMFILGLAVGSFLNVVIDRLPQSKSIIYPPSFCDECKKNLLWYDLIPVLSFIFLAGKCRFCRKKISLQYPIVEFTTACLFASVHILFISYPQLPITNYQLSIIYYLLVISALIAIFFIDLKYRIIPDQILIALTVISLAYQLFFGIDGLPNHLLAGISYFALLLLLVVVTKGKGMGLGDVKFAFVIGLLLGFPKVVAGFYLSFLTGAVISLILIIAGRKTMKSTIPFGPFLAASTAVSLYYGQELWMLFKRIIGI